TLRQTRYGQVIGFRNESDSHTWMGIPYAKPPVGALRWKEALMPEQWDGTLQALKAADFCKQIGSFGESRPPVELGKPIGSEDCLYLNIFAPRFGIDEIPRDENALPVMVYIHGGGNTAGYANQLKYSGRNLAARHNVIVVNFNYRLGLFGWFSHPALNRRGSAEDRSILIPMMLALLAPKNTSNQRSIDSFGVDPDNVTLFGESAGGMNVFALLASPNARGLFHKAIVQSGMPISIPLPQAQNYIDADEPGSENSSREVMNKLLMSDGIVGSRVEAVRHQNQMSDEGIASYL
ncbi:MAG TPA: carboxylesterase, partial [Gammaproteobacteria bacterium]|nr:carboxylesterase [Gammaproteobacteria bacterium]